MFCTKRISGMPRKHVGAATYRCRSAPQLSGSLLLLLFPHLFDLLQSPLGKFLALSLAPFGGAVLEVRLHDIADRPAAAVSRQELEF